MGAVEGEGRQICEGGFGGNIIQIGRSPDLICLPLIDFAPVLLTIQNSLQHSSEPARTTVVWDWIQSKKQLCMYSGGERQLNDISRCADSRASTQCVTGRNNQMKTMFCPTTYPLMYLPTYLPVFQPTYLTSSQHTYQLPTNLCIVWQADLQNNG